MYTSASVKALTQIKDVDDITAKRVRAVWKAENQEQIDTVMYGYADGFCAQHDYNSLIWVKYAAIDRLIDTHGVEYLGEYKRTHEPVRYCNAGDSYATTVIFICTRLIVGCVGDIVERNQLRPARY